MRNWAAFDPAAQNAVRAIDRRRLDYIEAVAGKRGLAPAMCAGARADPVLDVSRFCAVRRAGAGGTAATPAGRDPADGGGREAADGRARVFLC